MIDTADLDHLDAQQLRERWSSRCGEKPMAVLKRLKFAAKSEAFNAEQKSLLEETIDADVAAMERELE